MLVLVGPPGAGKTTVGALLAQRWGVPLHDTDAAVEATAGKSISDIFVDEGEARFRELERQEVLRALQAEPGVLALGGGAVLAEPVQRALLRHRVVFLDVGIADAAKRVGFDASRPLLVVNPRASWVRLMQARRATYEAVSGWTVDTAGQTPQDVAELVAGQVGPLPVAPDAEPG